jgi:endonuclease/exonuclease/phosphatase family metal-dependent hydrolase
MTVNLLFGGADTAQVARLVRDRHVDVLALQELSPGAVAGLERAGLRSDLPYAINHPRTGAAGTGLWSRYPLREVPSRRLTFEAAAGELRVGGSLLRVRAVHPISPVPPARWRRDLATLRAQRADDVGVLTIIVGDLNASVHHRELRRLLGGRWRDAAEAAGAGLVRTWSPGSPLPSLIDLDHVLIDRGMTATGWRSVVIRRSDHRAVLVDVALP